MNSNNKPKYYWNLLQTNYDHPFRVCGPSCNNGIVEIGEECDSVLGCSDECEMENLFSCITNQIGLSKCSECGNGTITVNE